MKARSSANGAALRIAIKDDAPVLEFFATAWSDVTPPYTAESCNELVRRTLARVDFWGSDLNSDLAGFDSAVSEHLHAILRFGMRSALERVAG